ncbi:MAG: hypothetical protein HQK50_09380 [Oligoflexia bacterium]|nr:hypothetical protein [Oligoflexia bacterium]MBF0365772.1 hypothetical protein [Oligoflexia bacterium]
MANIKKPKNKVKKLRTLCVNDDDMKLVKRHFPGLTAAIDYVINLLREREKNDQESGKKWRSP